MFRVVSFFQIACDDCGTATPPQNAVEYALADADSEGFVHYGKGDGTGKDSIWRCAECALAYEREMEKKNPMWMLREYEKLQYIDACPCGCGLIGDLCEDHLENTRKKNEAIPF